MDSKRTMSERKNDRIHQKDEFKHFSNLDYSKFKSSLSDWSSLVNFERILKFYTTFKMTKMKNYDHDWDYDPDYKEKILISDHMLEINIYDSQCFLEIFDSFCK